MATGSGEPLPVCGVDSIVCWLLGAAIYPMDISIKSTRLGGSTFLFLFCVLIAGATASLAEPLVLSDATIDLHEMIESKTLEQRLLEIDSRSEAWHAATKHQLSLHDQDDHADGSYLDDFTSNDSVYQYQILPPGLMYRSYLAGEKEPRMMWSVLYDTKRSRTIWETALGARVGLFRYGTEGATRPEGYQLDLEGAVFARLIPAEPSTMLEGADFRFGLLNTWREDRLAVKWGYYHVSSHLGDEFLIVNPDFDRINYVRDAAIVGVMADVLVDTQVYGEVANALGSQGGAKPWEFQFGSQYVPTRKMFAYGSPYVGANTYMRQDFGFRSGFNFIAGWNWYGEKTGERLRVGMQYYRGPSLQYSFFDRSERLIGGGIWLDY